jgi:hypothetical protein
MTRPSRAELPRRAGKAAPPSRTRRRAPRMLACASAALLLAGASTRTAGSVPRPSAPTQVAPAAPPPLPSSELSSPSITSAGSGRIDLFLRSSAGRLVHQFLPTGGSWTREIDFGGALRSQPAAVSWSSGRLDVFVRGTDDVLWHRSYSGGRWSRWESLGGVLTSAPAVASWGPGRLDVFVRGGNGALYHKWYAGGTGWSGWANRGGTFASSPTVATWGTNRLDVFARGTDNAIHHRSFEGTTWSGWERLGGVASSQPAATSPGPGMLDVVVRGTDQAVWLTTYRPGTGWRGWTSRGGVFASGPGAMATGDDVRIAGRSPNGDLYQSLRPSPAGTWSAWARVDRYVPFRRLSTWVDVFDYASLDPATAVPDMRARGVRVLFLATARFNGTTDIYDPVEAGRWLDLAHQNGIKVVGWYLPAYGDMARDVRRTLAIARFVSPGGQRFDGVGVDIERLDEVSLAQFNQLAVSHLSQVRAQSDAMIAAIVPSPFATDPGNRWAGFPWASIGANSDVVVPMALWSFRSNPDGTPYTPDQVHAWVLDQVRRARSATGRPVTVEGGVDDPGTERTPVTGDRVARFVDAAIAGGAIGGSHYDYATTLATYWPTLARLNGL